MKILKKLILLIIAGIVSIALFAGCGSKKSDEKNSSADSKTSQSADSGQTALENEKHLTENLLVGDWKCENIKTDGVNMTPAQYQKKKCTDFDAYMSFSADGTLSYTSVIGEKSEQYYTSYNCVTDSIATINGSLLKYNKKSDMLSLIENEDNHITFKRI